MILSISPLLVAIHGTASSLLALVMLRSSSAHEVSQDTKELGTGPQKAGPQLVQVMRGTFPSWDDRASP